MPTQETILAVDDEPLILSAYQRNLGDRYNILTAEGPELALSALRNGSFAVVLTDLKMPGIDGIELLRQVRQLQPDCVRMMISGHADMGDAINSVNNAGIFRLLIKPCPADDLAQALDAALAQHRLITAEKALLEGTLNGAIQALTDILGILDADAFGQAQLRRQLARTLAQSLHAPTWEFEIAAQLAEIGRATLPTSLNEKLKAGQKLTEAEARLLERVPEFSYRLLHNIPRIESVMQAVLYQNKDFNGHGFPDDDVRGTDIPLAGRALHAIKALMAICRKGTSPEEAIGILKLGPERYDPDIVAHLYPCAPLLQRKQTHTPLAGPQHIALANLVPGMILLADIVTRDGVVVLGQGTRLTAVQVQRIKNFAQLNTVAEPLLVELPRPDPAPEA